MKKNILFLLMLPLLLTGCMLSSPEQSVLSPDGRIEFQCETGSDGLTYSVTVNDVPLIDQGQLGLSFKSGKISGKNLKLVQSKTTSADETWEPVWGNYSHIRNYYHQLHLFFEDSLEAGAALEIVVRVFNDGAAFRYIIPEQPGLDSFELKEDLTTFPLTHDVTVWAADYGSFRSHQETEFVKQSLSDISESAFVGCPLLIKTEEGPWAALMEADLTDWAGLYFTTQEAPAHGVKAMLSTRLDDPSIAVKGQTPAASPWRVIMIGDHAGDLIESELVYNLNDPCAIEDPSWIEPGFSSWDRWWCGSYAPDLDIPLAVDTPGMKYFIDFSAEMGWEYQLVDWEWYGPPFDPEKPFGTAGNPAADLTRQKSDIDIEELVRYGREKNVKILIWLDSFNAFEQMEKAFPLYEKWGVAGVKVDFMARDDQEMVQLYHDLVRLAAKHHLVVDFHGAYKPTGIERTWPNLMTREGVLGNEYNKWSDRVTPRHNVTLPYTRMLCGPMDYTPGGFLNRKQADFNVVGNDAPAPQVMGTRCHQLAMTVIYESPLQVMCDSPYNYRQYPDGLDLLKEVPATWDETRFIAGEPGDYIVMARRKGIGWYIAGMNGGGPRTIAFKLDFVEGNTYACEWWTDDAASPQKTQHEESVVVKNQEMSFEMGKEGGFVFRLKDAP